MRGLAALMVAAAHAFVVYPTGDVAKALAWIFNGDAAVTLFFILSGVVLGKGLQSAGRGSAREFSAYAVRRICRIYPAFFITTLMVLAFLSVVHAVAGADFWFNQVLAYRPSVLNSNIPVPGHVARDNLFLLSASLNLVTWTLGVEMFCSLLLPLAHYAKVRMPPSGTWLLLVFSGFLLFLGKWFLLLGWRELEGAFPWETIGYFYLFYLGYLLPAFGFKLFSGRSSPAGNRVIFAVAAIVFLSARTCGDTYRVVAGTSAWIMLGVIMYGVELREFSVLDSRVVRFYGKISYSFYLLHDLALISLARINAHFVFDGRVPSMPLVINAALLVLSVALATVAAMLMHQFVEVPCITLGKRIAQKIRNFPKEPVPAVVAAAIGR